MKSFFRNLIDDYETLHLKQFIKKYQKHISEMTNIKKVDEILCNKVYSEIKWKIQSIPIT